MSEHEPTNEPTNEPQPQYPTYPVYPAAGAYPTVPQPDGEYAGPPQGEGGYAGPPAPAGSGYPVGSTAGYPPPGMFGSTPPAPPPAQGQAQGPSSDRASAQTSARRTILVAAVIAALIGGGIGAGTVALADNNNSGNNGAGLTFSTQAAPASKTDGTVEAAAKKIGPSVVTVNVSASQEADTGSGVIIRQDGYILTNNHVIAAASGGGATISVTLANGKQVPAKIVGTDPSDDLAVLKVGLTGLTAATFASSSSLQVGQTVVAVGAPLGLSDTVTSGIVSTISRPVTTSDDQNDQAVFDAVQTDAAINPGNSGGPLVNLNGDVVGINAAIATDQSQGGLQLPGQQSQSGNIGIGFAIPSDEASRIATELISTGKATHAVMGVEVAADSSSGVTTSGGAKITKVTAGSAAAKAGLRAGDVVTSLAGQSITAADALIAAVRSHEPGQKVSVTYTRAGASKTVTLTLGTGSS